MADDSLLGIPDVPWQGNDNLDIKHCDDFNSPGDFVAQMMSFVWQTTSTTHIFSNIAEDKLLSNAIPMQNDPFGRFIKTISYLAKHYTNSTFSALVFWRRTMNPAASLPVDLLAKKKQKTAKEIANNAIDVRREYLIDHVFLEAIGPVVDFYDGKNVRPDQVADLEDACINFLLRNYLFLLEKGRGDIETANQKNLLHRFLDLLYKLSKYRISEISTAIFKEIETYIKHPAIITYLLTHCQGLVMDPSSADQVSGMCNVITAFNKNWKVWIGKAKKDKQIFVDFLANLLTSALVPNREFLDGSTQWQTALSALHQNLEPLLKKKEKSPAFLFPLAASALSLMPRNFFLKGFESQCEMYLVIQKDVTSRTFALEALFNILYTNIVKFNKDAQSQVQAIAKNVGAKLFPIGTKKLAYSPDLVQIDIIVDIINLLAVVDPNFVLSNVVKPFLENAAPHMLEPVTIGLLSYATIYDRISGRNAHGAPLLRPRTTQASKLRKIAIASLFEKDASCTTQKLPEPVLGIVSKSMATIFNSCSVPAGTSLLLCETAAKSAVEHLGAKAYQYYAYSAAVYAAKSIIIHQKEDLHSFLFTVARCTIHIEPSLRETATSVIANLMKERIIYRPAIIKAYARFLLTIPEDFATQICAGLNMLASLLELYTADYKTQVVLPFTFESLPHAKDAFNPGEVNAVIITYLCSPVAAIRKQVVDLIPKVKHLGDLLDTNSEIPLLDLINKYEEEILIQAGYKRYELMIRPPKVHNFKSIMALADSMTETTTLAEALPWLHTLAGITYYASLEAASTSQALWSGMGSRAIYSKQMLDKTVSTDPSYNARLLQWAMHSAVGCACAGHGGEASPVELFFASLIVPIRDENSDLRLGAEAAISFIQRKSYPALINATASSINLFTNEKTKRNTKLQNGIAAAFIYRLIAENKHCGYIKEKGILKKMVTFLCCQLDKFPASYTPGDDPLEWQFRRFNLCLFIKYVFDDLMWDEKENFDLIKKAVPQGFFYKLFEFAVSCSGLSDADEFIHTQQNKDRKAIDQVTTIKDKAAYLQQFEAQAAAVEFAGQGALASLVCSKLDDAEVQRLQQWLRNAFTQGTKASRLIGQQALKNYLRANSEEPDKHFVYCVRQCYSSNKDQAANYFNVLSELYCNGEVPFKLRVEVILSLVKLSDKDPVVRKHAQAFTKAVGESRLKESFEFPYNASMYDDFFESQMAISQTIAKNHSKHAIPIIEEVLLRFKAVDDAGKERLLRIINHWLPYATFNSESMDLAEACALLEKFTLITYNYGDMFSERVQQLWAALAREENIEGILNYLISQALSKRCDTFIHVARRVLSLLSKTLAKQVVAKLAQELNYVDKIPFAEDEQRNLVKSADEVQLEEAQTPNSWFKDACFQFKRNFYCPPLSRSDIASIFLSDIILKAPNEVRPHLHVILLTQMLNIDCDHATVRKYVRHNLANLLHVLAPEAKQAEVTEFVEALKIEGDGFKWRKSDLRQAPKDNALSSLLNSTIALFDSPDLSAKIAAEAAQWMDRTVTNHTVLRCMQIYVALEPNTSKETLGRYLRLLSKSMLASEEEQNLELAKEVLHSLHAIVDFSEPAALVELPQLLWLSTAFLQSEKQDEFIIGANLLKKVLQKLNFREQSVISLVADTYPKDWQANFSGLQRTTIKGIVSSEKDESKCEATAEAAVTLLQRYTLIENDSLIEASKFRLVDNFVGQLPWLVMQLGLKKQKPKVYDAARKAALELSLVFKALKFENVATVLVNYSNGDYSVDEFVSEVCNSATKFFAGLELRVLITFLGFLMRGAKSWSTPVLKLVTAFTLTIKVEENQQLAKQLFIIIKIFISLLDNTKHEGLAITKVLEACVLNSKSIEKYEFTMWHDVSAISKSLDQFPKQFDDYFKYWIAEDENEEIVKDAVNKVVNSIPELKEEEVQTSIGNVFPTVEIGLDYSSSSPFEKTAFVHAGKVVYDDRTPTLRPVLLKK